MKKIQRSSEPAFFLSKNEQKAVIKAIQDAEKDCSGEIRVHIARWTARDVMTEAQKIFLELDMTQTKLRNGILIYFSIQNRAVSILGDSGIDEKMGPDLWKDTARTMEEFFKKDEFADGLVYGIHRIGAILKTHFPHQIDDVNELPDTISFQK